MEQTPSDASKSSRKRSRRIFRFSLRTLLALMLIASLSLAWLGVRGRRMAVIAELKAQGVELRLKPPPSWVEERLGSYFGQGLTRVEWADAPFFGARSKSDMRAGRTPLTQLAQLTDMRRLRLDYCYDVDDRSSQPLRRLRRLEELSLTSTNAGDGTLETIGRLRRLTLLQLNNTQITDEGCKFLRRLTSLKRLDLRNTAVTGEGLRSIAELRSLKRLNLAQTQLTDEDVSHLGGLTELTNLNLSGTEVTGDGLAALAGLHELETLWLSGSPLTDAAAIHLAKLPKLLHLHVRLTQLTDAGLLQLAAAPSLLQVDVQNTGRHVRRRQAAGRGESSHRRRMELRG